MRPTIRCCFNSGSRSTWTSWKQGLRAAQVPLKASKEALKETAIRRSGGATCLGSGSAGRKQHPELRELYDSKLIIAQKLLQQWVTAHPDDAAAGDL